MAWGGGRGRRGDGRGSPPRSGRRLPRRPGSECKGHIPRVPVQSRSCVILPLVSMPLESTPAPKPGPGGFSVAHRRGCQTSRSCKGLRSDPRAEGLRTGQLKASPFFFGASEPAPPSFNKRSANADMISACFISRSNTRSVIMLSSDDEHPNEPDMEGMVSKSLLMSGKAAESVDE